MKRLHDNFSHCLYIEIEPLSFLESNTWIAQPEIFKPNSSKFIFKYSSKLVSDQVATARCTVPESSGEVVVNFQAEVVLQL